MPSLSLHSRGVRLLLLASIVAAACVLSAVAARSAAGRAAENWFLDARFLARNTAGLRVLGLYRPPPVHPDIVIVGLDRRTYEGIDVPSLQWNPYYASVVGHICHAGCKALGVDIIQTVQLDRIQPGGDEMLAEAFAGCPHIVLVYPIVPKEAAAAANFAGTPADEAARGWKTEGVAQYPIFRPFITDVDDGLGVMNLMVDEDGTVRRHALFRGLDRDAAGNVRSVPTFAFQLLRRYSGALVKAEDVKPGVPCKVGSWSIPWDDTFSIRINYAGPAHTFPYLSFLDVKEQAERNNTEYFRRNFANKIVLLGEADPLVFSDMKMTPYFGAGRQTTPGIEIHANVLNTILTDGYLLDVTPSHAHLLAWSGALATAALVYAAAPGFTFAWVISVLALYLWVAFANFSLGSRVLPVVEPCAAILLAGLQVVVLRVLLTDRQANVIRSVFEKYVTPQVVKEILKAPHQLRLGGEKIEASILFSDINNFTTMSHDMDPQHVISLLNEYFEIMTRVILKHGGTLQAFLGDGIMVLYNAPVRQSDHARRAVLTAIEMMEELEIWQRDRLERGLQTFWIKVGVNTGPVVVGNLGSHLRMEYTSIGDAVNLASRIMDATKAVGCDILISHTTWEQVRDQVEGIDRGGVKVKGVDEKLHVYEVVGLQGSTRPRPRFPQPQPAASPSSP